MAVREHNNARLRRILIPTVLIAIIGVLGISVSGLILDPASAARLVAGGSASVRPAVPETSTVPAPAPASTVGLSFPYDESAGAYLVGEYEGEFNPATGKITLREQARTTGKAERPGGLSRVSSRISPGAEVPNGSGFSFSVVNSVFNQTGTNSGVVSGEIQLTNNTSATLYNTRIAFTSFKVNTAAGPDALDLPGPSGLSYFNDGLVPFNGKLVVSRYVGDIAAGASVKHIWNFSMVKQPPKFSFAYKVLADLGVTVESVQPAAVQVTSGAGTSVQINGRGFSTPTVELINSTGTATPATVSASTGTSITATVPAGTAAGIYDVRVTNQGGTAGGAGSSRLIGRLTVTGAPDAAHTLTGNITSLADTGPYLINGSATFAGPVLVLEGTVIYVANGATITLNSAGNISANGGINGIPNARSSQGKPQGIATPKQIVFTAQRAAGAALPSSGAWGGINATVAGPNFTMSNVVVEYGGSTSNAAINITGSGRSVYISDSVVRNSAGSAITANGVNDRVLSFTRNLIANNGTTPADPAVLLSGNAALGLYEIPGSDVPKSTSVGDASYFYSSANDFSNNSLNAVQIGTAADAASNDFTRSGVLVGQGETPLIIQGSSSNPSIIGVADTPPPASGGGAGVLAPTELSLGPASAVQLAPGMNLLVGDFATNKMGGLSANGAAGLYQGTQAATSNKYIEFKNVTGGGNFGAIFFSRLATSSSILDSVKISNGGSGSLGSAALIAEGATITVANSQIDGGFLETLGAMINRVGTTFTNTATAPIIDTIAGGILGDRNQGIKAVVANPTSLVADPLGRGIFIADTPGTSYIRFLNTTRQTVRIAGIDIPAGVIRNLAGGGIDFSENVPGTTADVGVVTGIAVSPDASVLYFIDSVTPNIRALNLSSAPRTIAGAANIGVGNVQTFATVGIGTAISSLATHPTTGELYLSDATPNVNKVLKFPASPANSTTAPVVVAGTGAATKDEDTFLAGSATTVPLLIPRALAFNGDKLLISDTGHGRVIEVNSAGNASLVAQFPFKPTTASPPTQPYTNNPYVAGITVLNGKIFLANGNAQDLIRIDTPSQGSQPPVYTTIAGTVNSTCDYSQSTCGDGGPTQNAQFLFNSRNATIPIVGLVSDGKGLYVADQGPLTRGRVRYINLSQSTVEIAGVSIGTDKIDTVAGVGLAPPYDGALATSASLNQPIGISLDPDGNLWITDSNINKIRFANLGTTTKILFPASGISEREVAPGTLITVNSGMAENKDIVDSINASYTDPHGIHATAQGIFVTDSRGGKTTTGAATRKTGLLRFINTTSTPVTMYSGATAITVPAGNTAVIAGGSTSGDLTNVGDGAAPLGARLIGPTDVVVHPTTGNIYIADAGHRRVRLINRQTGAISTLTALSSASPNEYTGLAVDSQGRLLVANAGNKQILREKSAGSATFDVIVSGAPLNRPRDVVEGRDGALYVVNAGDSASPNYQIVKITLSGGNGTATSFVGSSLNGYAGDGLPISANTLIDVQPEPINVTTVGTPITVRPTVNIIVGRNGELIFADSKNNAIRRIR